MGVTIRQKVKDGPWYVFVHHNGKKVSRKIGSKQAAQKAKRDAEKALAQKKLGIVQDNQKTFAHYCDEWIKIIAPRAVKASTLKDYEALVENHVKGWTCYQRPIVEITTNDVEALLAKKGDSLSASSVKHIKTCLSLVFKRAIKSNEISVNPCREADNFGNDEDKDEKAQAYNEAEVETLLETFTQSRPEYRLLIEFMIKTGLRCGEIVALTWDDLDLDNRIANVERSFVRGKISKPKSGKGRKVDLTPALVAELRKAKLASGSNLVFTNSAGERIDFNVFRRRVFNKVVAKAKLPPRRLHDLRHTYASLVLKKTRDILYCQKQLGHSKPSITLDVYSHFLEDNSPTRLVDKLDAPKGASGAPKRKKGVNHNG